MRYFIVALMLVVVVWCWSALAALLSASPVAPPLVVASFAGLLAYTCVVLFLARWILTCDGDDDMPDDACGV